jgi:hypothetical protein
MQTSNFGGSNVYMVGTSSSGLFMWRNVFDWNWSDQANGVARTDDGGYVVVGETNSFGLHSYGMYLQKFDHQGYETGFQLFSWGGDQYGQAIRQTLDGGYIIAGNRQLSSPPDYDIVILKTDSNAVEEWRKFYGGPSHDKVTDIQILPDGGYIVAGFGERSTLWHSFDVWVLRLDANGDTLWTKFIGEEWLDESAKQIRCLPDGGYIIAGNRQLANYDTDAYLVRLGPDPATSITNEPEETINDFVLHQNYPNPFNPKTVISWRLAVGNHVRLSVYNPAGQLVSTLLDEERQAGTHSITFNASNLASGIYYYHIQIGSYQEVKKMILMK